MVSRLMSAGPAVMVGPPGLPPPLASAPFGSYGELRRAERTWDHRIMSLGWGRRFKPF
jgi:hypothetical protein